jgi:hypothetical protein
VYIGELDVNAEQVKRGMAWVYRKYAHDPTLLELEQEARKAKRGLWSDLHATPPWEYRHNGKQAASVQTAKTASTGKSKTADGLSCGSKHYCKEMVGCEEARFYLTQCGLLRLDGDGDGVPCESLHR